MKNTALLFIDVTEDYLKQWGAYYIDKKEAERVIMHMKEQLLMATKSSIPVIYAVPKNSKIIDELKTLDGVHIENNSYSAFIDTPLEKIMKEMNVNNLIIAGVNTHTSILFTIYDAVVRNYEITVIEDCIASHERMYHTLALKIIRDYLKVNIM